MSRCEYSYYVTFLPCNQFYRGGGRRGEASHMGRAPGRPLLRTATAFLSHTTRQKLHVETRINQLQVCNKGALTVVKTQHCSKYCIVSLFRFSYFSGLLVCLMWLPVSVTINDVGSRIKPRYRASLVLVTR